MDNQLGTIKQEPLNESGLFTQLDTANMHAYEPAVYFSATEALNIQ